QSDSTLGDRARAVNTYREMCVSLGLADETTSGAAPEVLSARRVEDSGLWLQYMDFKRSIQKKLIESGQERCELPQEVGGGLGHASLWAELDAERLEARDLSASVNELLLWHGTSREAAESIAEQGFAVSEKSTHGRRYGPGIYLAEELSKSISYCPEKAGSKYVLLCRAVCGETYYTEKGWHDEAGKEAATNGKHSVLANPGKQGPREYILLESAQVYPEYIVEFSEEPAHPDTRAKQTRVYSLNL
ncbi:Parp12, partial [Symbiodinium pilosum]